MKIEIMVRVSTWPDDGRTSARVRKVIWDENGRVVSKSILSSYGEWIDMGSNPMFPENSELEAQIHKAERPAPLQGL